MLKADEERKAVEAQASIQVVCKSGWVKQVSIHDYRDSDKHFEVCVKISVTEPGVKAAYQKYIKSRDAVPPRPDLTKIQNEIMTNAQLQAPGVDQLLSDPVIREKLEKAGEAILLKSAAASSIVV